MKKYPITNSVEDTVDSVLKDIGKAFSDRSKTKGVTIKLPSPIQDDTEVSMLVTVGNNKPFKYVNSAGNQTEADAYHLSLAMRSNDASFGKIKENLKKAGFPNSTDSLVGIMDGANTEENVRHLSGIITGKSKKAGSPAYDAGDIAVGIGFSSSSEVEYMRSGADTYEDLRKVSAELVSAVIDGNAGTNFVGKEVINRKVVVDGTTHSVTVSLSVGNGKGSKLVLAVDGAAFHSKTLTTKTKDGILAGITELLYSAPTPFDQYAATILFGNDDTGNVLATQTLRPFLRSHSQHGGIGVGQFISNAKASPRSAAFKLLVASVSYFGREREAANVVGVDNYKFLNAKGSVYGVVVGSGNKKLYLGPGGKHASNTIIGIEWDVDNHDHLNILNGVFSGMDFSKKFARMVRMSLDDDTDDADDDSDKEKASDVAINKKINTMKAVVSSEYGINPSDVKPATLSGFLVGGANLSNEAVKRLSSEIANAMADDSKHDKTKASHISSNDRSTGDTTRDGSSVAEYYGEEGSVVNLRKMLTDYISAHNNKVSTSDKSAVSIGDMASLMLSWSSRNTGKVPYTKESAEGNVKEFVKSWLIAVSVGLANKKFDAGTMVHGKMVVAVTGLTGDNKRTSVVLPKNGKLPVEVSTEIDQNGQGGQVNRNSTNDVKDLTVGEVYTSVSGDRWVRVVHATIIHHSNNGDVIPDTVNGAQFYTMSDANFTAARKAGAVKAGGAYSRVSVDLTKESMADEKQPQHYVSASQSRELAGSLVIPSLVEVFKKCFYTDNSDVADGFRKFSVDVIHNKVGSISSRFYSSLVAACEETDVNVLGYDSGMVQAASPMAYSLLRSKVLKDEEQ
jgi:hypothetical protein